MKKSIWSILIALAAATCVTNAKSPTPNTDISDMKYHVMIRSKQQLMVNSHTPMITSSGQIQVSELIAQLEEKLRAGFSAANGLTQQLLQTQATGQSDYLLLALQGAELIKKSLKELPASLNGSGLEVDVFILPLRDSHNVQFNADADLSKELNSNFYAVKAHSIGTVNMQDPAGKLPAYFLGAHFRLTLSQKSQRVTAQLGLGLNPAQTDAGDGMTFIVPATPSFVRDYEGGQPNANDAPNLLMTAQMNLSTTPAPTVQLEFGRFVAAAPNGVLELQIDPGSICQYTYLTPYITGAEGSYGAAVHLRSLQLRIGAKDLISDAVVGVQPPIGACTPRLGFINREFQEKANATSQKQTQQFQKGLLNLLNSSTTSLTEAVIQMRDSLGINRNQ